MSERNRLQTLLKNADRAQLRAVFPRILRHERGRLKWMGRAIRSGDNAEQLRGIITTIKKAWRWNILRLPGLMLRRRKVQKMRRVAPEEVRRFILPGVNEGGHQGDVDRFHDRHSATPRAQLRMGDTDDGTIGTGWHVVENPPGAVQPYRWCKDEAWFYLAPGAAARELRLKTCSPVEPHRARFFVEGRLIGELEVGAEVRELAFPLPQDLPRGRVLEFRIESEWFRPSDRNGGGDLRQLGLIVFEAAAV